MRILSIHSSNSYYRAHFRFTKQNLLRVVDLVHDDLARPDDRGQPLSPLQQVALALAFYASDSFLRIAGRMMGVKKNCAHVTVKEVTNVFCRSSHKFISMPTNAEMRESANKLSERFGIPNIPLGVDGTQIRLDKKPNESEIQGLHTQDFWCRKQFYAINVQMIGDGGLLIRDLDVRWAGSTHDARIWRNSAAKVIIERQSEFCIVGDSAYPISRTLIKPFKETPTRQHQRFNRALTGLRTVCTENIIGIWKRRFPCLRMGLRMKLETSVKIIRATGVLHNLAVVLQDPLPDEVGDANDVGDPPGHEEEGGEQDRPVGEIAARAQGVARRENIFAQFSGALHN